MVNCRQCTYPSFYLFMALDFKITIGLHTRDGLLGPYCKKKWRAAGMSTRADSCAFASEPQRFQTGQTPENRTDVPTPWSVFRISNNGRIRKKLAFRLTLPGSTAMHRSKLEIGGADAGTGGMSISSSSGDAGASGMGASSASSDASVMGHSTGSAGAGSGSIRFANKSPVACSSLAFSPASRKSMSLRARN